MRLPKLSLFFGKAARARMKREGEGTNSLLHRSILFRNLRGFVDILPRLFTGNRFGEGSDDEPPPHAWNAVYFSGGWRLMDCTWGAGRVNPHTREFEPILNEHFFMTDPDELIHTHFPHDEAEKNYQKWQLLEEPISLDRFNTMPLLTSMFFEYAMKLSADLEMPIVVQDEIDVKIRAWEMIRYKYKFFKRGRVRSILSCNILLSI